MKFFDLHCDTIMKSCEQDLDFAESADLHVQLPGIISSNTIAQVFACFILEARYPGKVFEACNACIDAIDTLVETHSDRFVRVGTAEQLNGVLASENKTAAIIAIEGAVPLEGKVERMEHFYARGVRLLTIAWDDNEFCGTVFGNRGGLTDLGQKLVRVCNELGVAVDVSHASDKAFYEIAAVTTMPFLASHSNARHLCPNDRNLTDDMIRILAERGGIIGLTYGSGFIDAAYHRHEKQNRERILNGLKDQTVTFAQALKISHAALSGLAAAPISRLVSHAKHILNVGGEACLALGSDFDGVESLASPMTGVQSLPLLVTEMEHQQIPPRVIDRICYQNAGRYFQEILH